MKRDYDTLFPVSENLYRTISLYLELKKKKKGEVLKPFGSVEILSRYICEGFIGVYYDFQGDPVLKYVLNPTDTAFDIQSYFSQQKSTIEIRALSDAVFFEFHKDSEIQVVSKFPEFARLGILINHRIQDRLAQQMAILRMDFKHGYHAFIQFYPGIEKHLKYSDWAGLFQCGIRTVSRVLNELKESNHEG